MAPHTPDCALDASQCVPPPQRVCLSFFSDSSPLPMQERLRHIGPEEFVQAFVNKDPLAGTKVKGSWES